MSAGAETVRARFIAERPFPLDRFQIEALDILDAGNSVLVAAPTGSGKTLVAEYAVERALAGGSRAFYTTPLKALSNQKYRDFVARYGEERVGLLTGDVSRRPDASVVVMTTEVLRNMIYAASHQLEGLACAVLDEVHYLEDRYRGSVWEEIILSAPPSVVLVCLSATVSNADELAGWITTVRGTTGVVIEARRPIKLENLYVVAERRAQDLLVQPTFVDAVPNPEAVALDAAVERSLRRGGDRRPPARARPGAGPLRRPRRVEVVERFAADELLPAIYFVFSRAGCDDAVRQCLEAGVRLTTPTERTRIRTICDGFVGELSDADLRVLGYGRFRAGLEAGVAPHHAGLVPPFREAVEALFTEALVKVIFATETLALGINMPARSVVIEALSKFAGQGHADLTAGEYTQLTGRAGRRGIDEIGYAAVLWSPFHRFDEVAALASSATRALRSSFRPNYNMAVNLVRRYSPDDARRLVRSSFAQYLSEVPLTKQFDAVTGLLEGRGYLAGWRLTASGERLAGLYHDCDLLVAEALGAGVFDGLNPPELAAAVSVVTFEARRSSTATDVPSAKLARRIAELDDIARRLREDERGAGLPRTRRVDAGFARLAFEWGRGTELRQLISPPEQGGHRARPGGDLSAGDFVRNVKQLVDLLRQIALVAPSARLAKAARGASEDLVRGVVAVSSGVPEERMAEVVDDPR